MYVLAIDDERIMLKELMTELGQVFPNAEIHGFQEPLEYITKPYSVRELTARVKANLRRSAIDNLPPVPAEDVNTITSGDLSINIERYEVSKSGTVIDITLREFELLKFLALQPEKVFSRGTLLEKVWGYEFYGDDRTVDVTVRRLREKIEDDPGMPRYIITKRGVGYYFNKA